MNLIEQLKARFANNPAALKIALEIVRKHEDPESLNVDAVIQLMTSARRPVQFALRNFAVDQEAGELQNLALITADREAKGHGLYIDAKTLEGAVASVAEKGGRLKAYIAHATWSQYWEGEDRLMSVPGYFENITVRGNQLVAGVFKFYDTFRESSPDDYARLMEMATKTPELFGLSIEAWGYAVFVAEDGTEYSAPPEDVELQYDGMPVFRITSLDAAAFVSEPAANDSLLANMRRLVASKKPQQSVEQLLKAFAQSLSAAAAGGNGEQNENTNKDNIMNIIKALKALFADNPAQLQKALAIVAASNDIDNLTVEQVQAQLRDDELAELREENERLSKEQAAAAKLAADKEKEAQESIAKFKAIRESGRVKEVEFGVPAIMQHKLTGYTAMAIDALASEGKFDFAAERTSIADVYIPSVWIPGVREKMNKLPGLWNSPVVVKTPEFDLIASGSGQTAVVPFHGDISDVEDSIQVENNETDTNKVVTGTQVAAMCNRELPFERTALAATIGALGDPLGSVLQQLAANRAKNRQLVLINTLRGLVGTALAANTVGTISESIAGQAAANMIDATKFNAAVAKLGELVSDLRTGVIVAHPDIIAALRDQDETSFTPPSLNNTLFTEAYKGVPIVPFSRLSRAGTTDGTVYDTWILGSGLVAYGEKPQSNVIGDVASLVVDGDARKNNVTLYDRNRFLVHVLGAKWVGPMAGSSPTNAEFATANKWELAFASADRVPAVRILSNG
jgi:hypothetical protein